jgi:hypothetical protein
VSDHPASLTHVLVQQHPDHERERVAAEQFVGGRVLGDAEGRHIGDGAVPRSGCNHLLQRGPSMDGALGRRQRDMTAVDTDCTPRSGRRSRPPRCSAPRGC